MSDKEDLESLFDEEEDEDEVKSSKNPKSAKEEKTTTKTEKPTKSKKKSKKPTKKDETEDDDDFFEDDEETGNEKQIPFLEWISKPAMNILSYIYKKKKGKITKKKLKQLLEAKREEMGTPVDAETCAYLVAKDLKIKISPKDKVEPIKRDDDFDAEASAVVTDEFDEEIGDDGGDDPGISEETSDDEGDDDMFGSDDDEDKDVTTELSQSVDEDFNHSEQKGTNIIEIMVFAPKGEGKTVIAQSAPGKIAAIGFDEKTKRIHEEFFNGDPRIKVYDGFQYIDKSSGEAWMESSQKTMRYLNNHLRWIAKNIKPDWIILDGIERLSKCAAKAMRYDKNLALTGGVAWGNWEVRNMYLDGIRKECIKAVQESKQKLKGIFYTAYPETMKTFKNNEIVDTKEYPKWVGDFETETDIVIQASSDIDEIGSTFSAKVHSSKIDRLIKTGIVVDVTCKPGAKLKEMPLYKILEASKNED